MANSWVCGWRFSAFLGGFFAKADNPATKKAKPAMIITLFIVICLLIIC